MKDSRGKKIPLLYSAFNNWQGQPMVKLVNFVRTTDKQEKPDIMEACRKAHKIRDDVTTLGQMRPREVYNYEKMRIEKEERFKNFGYWTNAI
jgi:hypothetical protein